MTVARLSVVIPPTGPWREQREWYRWAEDVGYDAAYTYDHLTHPTAPGQWLSHGVATLTAAAAATERIEVGTLVASATLHTPVELARAAMTVQDVAGGRLVLGLGAGSPMCAEADRGERPTPRQMAGRFADLVVGYRAVLAGETSWQGAHTSFSGLETLPRPAGVPDPFLLLAGHGPRALRLVVEHGDGWNTYGGPGSTTLEAEDFWRLLTEQSGRVDGLLASSGRDPGSLRRSLLLGFGRVQPATSASAYVAAAERAGDLGFDELVVYGPGSTAGTGSEPAVHEQALARLR
ncbi:MAG: class flavin-dependent oxidoreductase [Marmoricola sp.]|nr:class flavin-dependent oxidoreductase [Marmoricola sp.]